ncbi:MAG: CBS domain-containing protein, partial [Rhodospirillaceae bacterium]|nr:CBS domain-containing protein [Rhodospirillaceae bacterium]
MSTSTTRTIADILLPPEAIPVVPPRTLVKEALEKMSASKLGLACIVDDDGCLIGLFTDGDLRRLLLRSQKPLSALF